MRCNAFWDKTPFKAVFVFPPLVSPQPSHCSLLSTRIEAPARTRVGQRSVPRGGSLSGRRTAKTTTSRGESQVYVYGRRQAICPMCCIYTGQHTN